MQLYAYDKKRQLVAAAEALKHFSYTCIECDQAVRLRGGVHRRLHFFHFDPSSSCRLNGKSLSHLALQLHLYDLIGEKEVVLEKKFSEISRIADVVWGKNKIIFEIQCSPISAQEVKARMNDYEKIGYRVIWILHDQRFNQSNLSEAEIYLKPYAHFYTNMNEFGEGMIYDQLSLDCDYKRLAKSNPLIVDLHLFFPIFKKPLLSKRLKKILNNRFAYQSCHFKGDLLDHLDLNTSEWEDLSIKWTKQFSLGSLTFLSKAKRKYLSYFYLFLESIAR